jgi:hypothetical protein
MVQEEKENGDVGMSMNCASNASTASSASDTEIRPPSTNWWGPLFDHIDLNTEAAPNEEHAAMVRYAMNLCREKNQTSVMFTYRSEKYGNVIVTFDGSKPWRGSPVSLES